MIAHAKPCRPEPWPDVLRLSTAARMLDMNPKTFRTLAAVLAAHHGLTILAVCGRRVKRAQLMEVLDRLTRDGLEISVDNSARTVHVGEQVYPTEGIRR